MKKLFIALLFLLPVAAMAQTKTITTKSYYSVLDSAGHVLSKDSTIKSFTVMPYYIINTVHDTIRVPIPALTINTGDTIYYIKQTATGQLIGTDTLRVTNINGKTVIGKLN